MGYYNEDFLSETENTAAKQLMTDFINLWSDFLLENASCVGLVFS